MPHKSSVQLLSHVQLFVTPWTEGHQASLSFTISRSLLKLIFIKSVMPSNHLVVPLSSCSSQQRSSRNPFDLVLVAQSYPLFVTPWTVAHQAPLSMRFSMQGYWSGVPFPSAGDLHDLGIEPTSPAAPALAGRFFTTEPYEKPLRLYWVCQKVHLRFLMKNPNELFGQLSRCYRSPCHAPPNTV